MRRLFETKIVSKTLMLSKNRYSSQIAQQAFEGWMSCSVFKDVDKDGYENLVGVFQKILPEIEVKTIKNSEALSDEELFALIKDETMDVYLEFVKRNKDCFYLRSGLWIDSCKVWDEDNRAAQITIDNRTILIAPKAKDERYMPVGNIYFEAELIWNGQERLIEFIFI